MKTKALMGITLILVITLVGLVTAAAPVCSFDNAPQPTNLYVGGHAHFNDTSTETPEVWNWTIDDSDGPFYYVTKNITHQYDHVGVYDVTLWVGNQAGNDTCLGEDMVTVLTTPTTQPTTAPPTTAPTATPTSGNISIGISPVISDVTGLLPLMLDLVIAALPLIVVIMVIGVTFGIFDGLLGKIKL